jgi:hypothetical protein
MHSCDFPQIPAWAIFDETLPVYGYWFAGGLGIL